MNVINNTEVFRYDDQNVSNTHEDTRDDSVLFRYDVENVNDDGFQQMSECFRYAPVKFSQ